MDFDISCRVRVLCVNTFFVNNFFFFSSNFFLFATVLVEIPELAVDLMLSLCRRVFAGLGSLALGDK